MSQFNESGPLTIRIEGGKGTGKTVIGKLIRQVLQAHGYTTVAPDELYESLEVTHAPREIKIVETLTQE